LAIERLHDDLPHPGGKPYHRLVVGDRAVLGHVSEHLRVGDGPALEDQVTGFIINENSRAIIPTGVRVDACED
jgi:hypothetical protein